MNGSVSPGLHDRCLLSRPTRNSDRIQTLTQDTERSGLLLLSEHKPPLLAVHRMCDGHCVAIRMHRLEGFVPQFTFAALHPSTKLFRQAATSYFRSLNLKGQTRRATVTLLSVCSRSCDTFKVLRSLALPGSERSLQLLSTPEGLGDLCVELRRIDWAASI